jgi:hypothetical protein
MSAEIVDKETIEYLIIAIESFGDEFCYFHNGKWHHPKFEDRQMIGQLLWDTNIVSVKTRYNHIKDIKELPGPYGETFIYKYSPTPRRISINPLQVIKTCKYYVYQTCEFEGWEDSEAKAIIDAIINIAITKLPGYEEAEWGAPKEMYQKRT